MSGDFYAADFGKNQVHVSNASGSVQRVCPATGETDGLAKILSLLTPGDTLILEDSHAGVPRKESGGVSKSQYYTAERLAEFYGECEQAGVTLRLAPQGQTPSIRTAMSGVDSRIKPFKDGDMNDAWALAMYHSEAGVGNLKKPRLGSASTEPRRIGYAIVDISNDMLNELREGDYKRGLNAITGWMYSLEGGIKALDLLAVADGGQAAIEMLKVSRATRNAIGGWSETSIRNNANAMWSIVATLVKDVDGVPHRIVRSNATKEPIGFNWWCKNVVRHSPFHFRGGVARSNLWHWAFRFWAHKAYPELPVWQRKASKKTNACKLPRTDVEAACFAAAKKEFRKHEKVIFEKVSEAVAGLPPVVVGPKKG